MIDLCYDKGFKAIIIQIVYEKEVVTACKLIAM